MPAVDASPRVWPVDDPPYPRSRPTRPATGSVAVAGAVVSWLRDALGLIAQPADAEALALSVPDNGGVAFVPAFNGLFAPHWRSDARGIIIGATGLRAWGARWATDGCPGWSVYARGPALT